MRIYLPFLLLAFLSALSNPLFADIDNAKVELKLEMRVKAGGSVTTEESSYTDNDSFFLILEGDYEYKAIKIPSGPSAPTYPRKVIFNEPTKKVNLTAGGSGNSTLTRELYACHPQHWNQCKNFTQKGTESWSYDNTTPEYKEKFIQSLDVIYTKKNGPIKYKLKISGPYNALNEYVQSKGIGQSTVRNYEINETSSFPIETFGLATSPEIWEMWRDQSNGFIEGELQEKNGTLTDEKVISFPYRFTLEDGREYDGNLRITLRINPQPKPKKIEINQGIGRYKYVDEFHYNPATDFVAKKQTAIEVYFDRSLKAEAMRSQLTVEVERDGNKVFSLSDGDVNVEHNSIIFANFTADSNWQEGTYKFTAKIKDAKEELDNIEFKKRKKLKVMAIPFKSNIAGVVASPNFLWKFADHFLKKVYPLPEDNISWVTNTEIDLSAACYDLSTERGQKNVWDYLNWLYTYYKQEYDIIIGFMAEPIVDAEGNSINGFMWPNGHAVVVSVNQHSLQGTVAHEIAHLFNIGDEYNGGSYNFSVNMPPMGFVGTDYFDDKVKVTATDPSVKPFPQGDGVLIKKELNLLLIDRISFKKDSQSFMGSGVSSDLEWISPAIWKHLFNGLAPSDKKIKSSDKKENEAKKVVTLNGSIDKDDNISWNYPFISTTTFEDIETHSDAKYLAQITDENDEVLFKQNFTPVGKRAANEESVLSIGDVQLELGASAKKILIMNPDGKVINELQITQGIPEIKSLVVKSDDQKKSLNISFSATDRDSEQLFTVIEYSLDGKEFFVVGKTTSNSYSLPLAKLPGGSNAHIRIRTSDGINEASKTSKPFAVSAKAADVIIIHPTNNSEVAAKATTVFNGAAVDPQTGAMKNPQAFAWYSDIDGLLGYGEKLVLKGGLSVATHNISLKVTTPTNLVTTSTVSISAK